MILIFPDSPQAFSGVEAKINYLYAEAFLSLSPGVARGMYQSELTETIA